MLGEADYPTSHDKDVVVTTMYSVRQTLAATARGGIVVCAGIHMSDIPSFSYSLLLG